jgi:hypothetical protein
MTEDEAIDIVLQLMSVGELDESKIKSIKALEKYIEERKFGDITEAMMAAVDWAKPELVELINS